MILKTLRKYLKQINVFFFSEWSRGLYFLFNLIFYQYFLLYRHKFINVIIEVPEANTVVRINRINYIRWYLLRKFCLGGTHINWYIDQKQYFKWFKRQIFLHKFNKFHLFYILLQPYPLANFTNEMNTIFGYGLIQYLLL